MRVITFSLCDERTSPFPCDPDRGFDNYVSQVELAMNRAVIERAIIVGVSYGGLIATEFAARHPSRVSGLVLASALHASWEPDALQQRYLDAPTLMSPLFVMTAPARMRPEVIAALPSIAERLRFAAIHGARVVTAPTSPARMARRIAWARAHRFTDPRRITAPALVIVGAMMAQNVGKIDWRDHTEAIPAFLTLIGIPLSYSIADGLALGVVEGITEYLPISSTGHLVVTERFLDLDPPKGPAKNALDSYTVIDRKSTRLNSSHVSESRMPSSA